jgi:uncharacterized protein
VWSVDASLLLIGAGIVSGVVGSGGGVTSLVSYPALLAAGVPPLPASMANLIAGVAMGPGSALTSRRELSGGVSALKRLLPAVALGTMVGSGLLLVTPPGIFARMVPFLVASASILLVVQPALMKLRKHGPDDGAVLDVAVVGAVSIYGGYFGAGSGVMLLAVILLLVDARVPPANAIKNILVATTSLTAAAVFSTMAQVPWSAVIPLAGGLLVGSALGPPIVRRLPPDIVRWFAAAFGFVLAILLWFDAL